MSAEVRLAEALERIEGLERELVQAHKMAQDWSDALHKMANEATALIGEKDLEILEIEMLTSICIGIIFLGNADRTATLNRPMIDTKTLRETARRLNPNDRKKEREAFVELVKGRMKHLHSEGLLVVVK